MPKIRECQWHAKLHSLSPAGFTIRISGFASLFTDLRVGVEMFKIYR